MRIKRLGPLVVVLALVGMTGCGGGGSAATATGAATSTSMTLYTCATADVEQAVVAGFEAAHRGSHVDVFRAPTGQLNARIAADVRTGGIRADVVWACDPLTMYGYDGQHLLRAWSPPNAAEIPATYRTPHFVGIDLLEIALVVHHGVPAPGTWADLTGPGYAGGVAMPSPAFAASALGMLGYFASAPGYGMGWYQALKRNGAVQVDAPGDVLTGVEQGTYRVGATLANTAYADQHKGSPIDVVWPTPGAVTIYAPIGLTTRTDLSTLAAPFAAYAASRKGQAVMAGHDTYVTIPGLGGPPLPAGSPTVSPDWASLAGRSRSLLAAYVSVFGG